MAKNYTFAEAVSIIAAGKDFESLADIGRRYPIMSIKVAAVAAKAGPEFIDLMNYIPEYITANKINSCIKNSDITAEKSEDTSDDEVEETAKKEDADSTEKFNDAEPDYDHMSGKELWDILGKANARKTAKSTKKTDLIVACKALGSNAKAADEEVAEDNESNEESGPYDGKTAMELFKECKKRGIKAAPKKPAKFYADLLTKDDAASAKVEESTDSDDDWSDDEEEEKPAKKVEAKKTEKKPAKEAKKEEDDGEDWDI